MKNPVRDNVEMMLEEEIDRYLEADPKGLYVTGSEMVFQTFTDKELSELEEKVDNFERVLLNLIFLTEETDIINLDDHTKKISSHIIAIKEAQKYLFFKEDDNHHTLFDVISPEHYAYSEFDFELSRFFKEELSTLTHQANDNSKIFSLKNE